jgi:CBS domain containing-hemolysin-like protein
MLKLRNLLIVHAIVMLVLAAGLLLAPKTILGLFGLTVGTTVKANAGFNLVAQILGAALIVPGLVSWFAATMPDEGSRRSVAISLFVFNLVGFGVSLFVGMLPKAMIAAGWILVVLFLLFAVGLAYFLFMRPSDI